MKGARMLVVSLRGVNFAFWSHLGCSGQNAMIFSREGQAKKYKNIFDMYIFNSFYLLHSYNPSFLICLCFNMVSFRGQKSLAHAQIGLLLGFNSKFPTSIPTPFICEVPPRAQLERIDTINIFFVSFSTEKEFFFSLFYTSQILFTLQKQQINRRLKEFPVL